MCKKIVSAYFGLLFWLASISITAAAVTEKSSLGLVAKNLTQEVHLFSSFINSACLLLGAAFLFACLVKYLEHKRSPLMVPISTVVFLLIAGIIFLILPLLQLLQ